jgi:asparagine synthase (glutamine-hydrolysing)
MMSVQAGTLRFDHYPVSRAEVAFLLQGLEERAPDYAGIHVSGSIGLGFLGFNISPEDGRDQPMAGLTGAVVTFDGRLDNRDDLIRLLDVRGLASDARLTLAAFEIRAAASFENLAGEYAFVVWDAPKRELFLVRSRCGTRPLFFTANSSGVTWSSEIDDLVLKSGITPEINDAYAIGYLYYQPDIDESPFRNVGVVPPGSYIRIRTSGEIGDPVFTWHPERIVPLQLPSDADYEEAWREQTERAIASRLRTGKPIFCELSGGLDSSTVALLAHRLLANGGNDPAMLTTVSCTYETSRSCDETHFIEVVEQTRNRAGIHVSECAQRATTGLEDIQFTGVPNTGHLFPGRYTAIQRLMQDAGARVLLTGIGGDHVFWSDHTGSPELADFLIRGKLLAAVAGTRRWSQAAAATFRETFITWALVPIMSAHPWLSLRPTDVNARPWITNKARQWLNARGRSYGVRIDQQVRYPSLRARVHVMRSLSALISAGYFQEYHGIYFSHPLASQQVVDFVLSLPMNQLARPGEDRSLMRRASVGLLPEKVRTRKSKGSIDEMFCRVLEREQQLIGRAELLEVCRREYAEPALLAQAIREVALGRLDQSYALVRLFSLERWLRSLDRVRFRQPGVSLRQAESPHPAQEGLAGLFG